MSEPIAVTIFHQTDDPETFTGWARRLRATAATAIDFRVSVLGEPHLDWAVAVTFVDEAVMHEWLDSTDRNEVIRAGEAQGVLRATSDLVIGADGSVPSGIGVFRHTVAPGRAADFVTAENQLAEASKKFPGFERVCTFAPGADGESISVLRFRTDNQLKAWLSSDERINALGGLRSSLTHEFSLVSSTTAFGATIRTENGRTAVTPNWKTAMLILLVLYPTVMLLSRFLGPVLDGLGAPPWLGLWSSQVISVVALQWVLMPWAGRRFRRWLDPIDGASRRVSVLGAAVMVGGYAVTLMLFATVQWLQFWDYSPD
jgi:antibiotic biosynthesis monooxygenase (ABM) superfamily enzyme